MERTGGKQSQFMIDPHVHLRDWAQSDKETILHGLACYKKAGFTHVFDMPNTLPPITGRDAVLERLALASEAQRKVKGIAYHLYAGLTSDEKEISEVVSAKNELFPLVIGLKLFLGQSTGNMGIVKKEDQEKVIRILTRLGYDGVLAVHAEKESLFEPEKYVNGMFETHSYARPGIAEAESIADIIEICIKEGFSGTLHIAHVSTKESVEKVLDNRDRLKITMGATPHHALFCTEDAKDHSLFLKMNPPLRSKEDQEYIFDSLLDGKIDWVESDHAPHSIKDKENGASGIPGCVGMLVLLSRLRTYGCSKERLEDLFGLNAMRTFGLAEEEIVIVKNEIERARKLEGEWEVDSYRKLLS